jgi:SLAP domain-containing protein
MLSDRYKISYSLKEGQDVSRLEEKLNIDELNDLSGIAEGVITLKTIYIFPGKDKIEAKIFVFNSTNHNISFNTVPLFLLNERNEVIAAELMDLSGLGEIPPMNVRPHIVSFTVNKEVKLEKITEGSKVIIEMSGTEANEGKKLQLSFMDPKIDEYERIAILRYVNTMETIVENSIKFIPYKSGIDSDNKQYCILFIANATNKVVEIKGLNLVCRNSIGIIEACKKIQDIPDIEQKSILVYKFIFDKFDILQQSFNPENCAITVED